MSFVNEAQQQPNIEFAKQNLIRLGAKSLN